MSSTPLTPYKLMREMPHGMCIQNPPRAGVKVLCTQNSINRQSSSEEDRPLSSMLYRSSDSSECCLPATLTSPVADKGVPEEEETITSPSRFLISAVSVASRWRGFTPSALPCAAATTPSLL